MFKTSLQHLVEQTEGSVASLLMGFDGIAVDSYLKQSENWDIQVIGMELSFILTQIRRAAENLEVGKIEEFTLRTQRLTVIIHALNAEYFVALALTPSGNTGKGKYLLKIIGANIKQEL